MARLGKRLNTCAFTLDVLAGVLSDEEIAARYGLTAAEMKRVLAGSSRPHLARWIARWREECKENTPLRLAVLQRSAVDTFAAAMKGEASASALAAAKELLNHTLGADWLAAQPRARQEAEPGGKPDMTGLSPATQRLVLKELGWTDAEIDGDDEGADQL